MKRFWMAALVMSSLLCFGAATAAAELVTIYGPVYVTKAKHDHDGHKEKDKAKKHSEENEGEFKFTAPVPGYGIVVVHNGGDVGDKGRVSKAKIELNDVKLAGEKDFNKNVDVLRLPVRLEAENELEVEVKSCKKCEIAITVLGERERVPVRAAVLPVRGMPIR